MDNHHVTAGKAKRGFGFHSVSARYLARFIPIVLVALVALVAILGTFIYKSAYSDLEAQLDTLIAREALLLGEAVAENREERIGLLVAKTIADPDIATVAVIDSSGTILNKYGPLPETGTPLSKSVAINHFGEGSYRRVGTLIVSMSEEPAIASLTRIVVYLSLLGLALIAAASIAAHLVLRKTVSEPLGRMLNAIQIERESGARIPVAWDSPDQVGHVVSAFNDLQVRQAKTETDLTRLREKAERAHHSKSEFVARVIDELRTPLNTIVGFSDIVSSRRFGPDSIQRYVGYAGNINLAARNLLHLIENVLEVTRLEGGEVEAEYAPTELDRVIAEVEKSAVAMPRAKGVRLRVDRPAGQYTLDIDAELIGQLLDKLLENAFQNTPENGTVIFGFHQLPSGAASFTMADNGPGISETDIERLTIPFGAPRDFEERHFHGVGLGLPICKLLAEMHDGGIEIANRAEGGTIVTVTLPPNRLLSARSEDDSPRGDEHASTDHHTAGAPVQDLNSSV